MTGLKLGNHNEEYKGNETGAKQVQILWSRRLRNDFVATLCKGQKGLFITLSKRGDEGDRTRIATIPVDIELLLILHKEVHTIAKVFGVKLE